MNGCVRMIALVVALAGMTSSLAAQLASPAGPHEKPAGCHQHGNRSPERMPADYKCCVAGHGSAIVRPSCVSQTVLQGANVLPLVTPLSTGIADFMAGPPVSFVATPSIVPLRI